MAYAYTHASDETSPTKLPDCEIFKNQYQRCENCSAINLRTFGDWDTCPECQRSEFELGGGWFFWFCFPGCIPESDPFGPYSTESEALAAAREAAGACPHGAADDEACAACDGGTDGN